MSIQEAYNEWAGQYDENRNKTRDLDAIATRKILNTFTFSTVVELGCGTGKNTGYLLSKADRVIGIDFSKKMLEKAQAKFSEDHVEFLLSDISKDWNLPAACADLVTCNLVLEHIEDLNDIFPRAYDTLRQGGHFFISELHPFKQYLGSKARFDVDGEIKEMETYIHHISEYVNCALASGFTLVELNEWFDESGKKEIPRLIGILLRKNK